MRINALATGYGLRATGYGLRATKERSKRLGK